MVKKIEAMFPLLTSPPQSYPIALRTWALNGAYTPEEQDVLLGLIEIRVDLLQPHLDALPRVQIPDLLARTTMYFCIPSRIQSSKTSSRLPLTNGNCSMPTDFEHGMGPCGGQHGQFLEPFVLRLFPAYEC